MTFGIVMVPICSGMGAINLKFSVLSRQTTGCMPLPVTHGTDWKEWLCATNTPMILVHT